MPINQEGGRLDIDPLAIRYGCFLPNLTGLAGPTPDTSLPDPSYAGHFYKSKHLMHENYLYQGIASDPYRPDNRNSYDVDIHFTEVIARHGCF